MNLSQRFPNFAADRVLIEGVTRARRNGHNQYAPMAGGPVLRASIDPSEGTFFQHVPFADSTAEGDYDLAVRLTRELGVASIPVSVRCGRKNDYRMVRFCFAKDDDRCSARVSDLPGGV